MNYKFRRRALVALGLFVVGMVGLTVVASRVADRTHPWPRPAALVVLGASVAILLAGVVVASTLRKSQ